ncbi:DUF262 domain-containing protein [Sphingobacterium faecale]|uniref:DUF262 domain-containing protein n=1 Tax=Sphingobacterium faecale TaxID=2803775 RepID=A0ABS1R4E4_9SPHI|nr:DUF262 domain-containing protein [Sphingobacterium faecale]MBL1408701.1 DUF262 domain-containing protein [Sphingobacterium faecale]
MVFQNNILESGKEYTLATLFTNNNKVIIPDLQRDYCWGDRAWNKDTEKYSELVSGFLGNLIELYLENSNNSLTLGLIYGYENPKCHIQLCDGQQRLTTLFLILGIINKRSGNCFQSNLISNDELENDRLPYLQYSIRESTLYFFSDLVCQYFLQSENGSSHSKIRTSSWYFSEYDLDPSIKSILAAIETIEETFDKMLDFDYPRFGEFINSKLGLLYYDMGTRSQGEETFVIINTTGEPLSATENLKPILIGNIVDKEKRRIASEEWEEREQWFWQNRKEDEYTSDDGINDFFIWYWQIRLLQERSWKSKKAYPLNPRELFSKQPKVDENNDENPEVNRWKISLAPSTIHSYFKAFQRTIELCSSENVVEVLKTIKNESISVSWFRDVDLDLILPLIVYLEKYPNPQFFPDFARRLRKNHFDKKRKRGNDVDWRHIVQLIEFSEKEEEVLVFKIQSSEPLLFKSIANVELKEWFTLDEQLKRLLKKEHKSEVEYWEDHSDLMGDLTPLWIANEGREYSYNYLEEVYNTFELLYNCYDPDRSQNTSTLSNYVRLYRVLTENSRLTKPYNTRGMQGAWFSWKNQEDLSYFNYLKDDFYVCLFSLNNEQEIIETLKNRIRELLPITETIITDENFTAIRHLKIWLLVKVLKAEKEQLLLAFCDGRGGLKDGNGLASYDDCNKNKLNQDQPFSIGNSICGYAVKKLSYIEYAKSCWGQQDCFDTSVGNSITLLEFESRNTITIAVEKIQSTDQEIQNLINDFYDN